MTLPPSSETPDSELIVQLAAPESRREAARGLHRRYAGRFQAYLQRRGLDHASAEDAVQEAFIRLIRRAETFAPGPQGEASARAWIWAVARSVWLDLQKRPALDTVSLEEGGAAEQGSAPDVAQLSDYQDCVHGQLARFAQDSPEASQAILWAAVDGLPSGEIGLLLGRSAGATREFLSQTRKRLREYLQPCFGLL